MDSVLLATLGGIALLLVLSAFFSGSETALTAVSRPRMHQLEVKGSRRARTVNRLRERQEHLLGTVLLGNNLVNILASALATSVLIRLFGEAGVVYATLAMTLLVLLFGEMLPKTYAFRHADRVALAVAPVFRLLVVALSPVMTVIQWLFNGISRLSGVKAEEGGASPDIDELRGAIELHPDADSGEGGQERAMLRSVLDLAEVDVGMVMRHRRDLFTIDASQPTRDIVSQAVESPYTRIPLWRGSPDEVIGVMHTRDLLREVYDHAEGLEELSLGKVVTDPWFIPDTTNLRDQLQAFRERSEHFALVVDEYGALMGVVTLEDILEEIVGDISDEHDVVPVGVYPQRDGTFIVAGDVTLRDLSRRFGWDLPDQQYATIAGLVIHEARLIPEIGQIFSFYGFRLEILGRESNRITQIRMTPLQRSNEAPDEV